MSTHRKTVFWRIQCQLLLRISVFLLWWCCWLTFHFLLILIARFKIGRQKEFCLHLNWVPSISAARMLYVHDHFIIQMYLFFLPVNINIIYIRVCMYIYMCVCMYIYVCMCRSVFVFLTGSVAHLVEILLIAGVSTKYLSSAAYREQEPIFGFPSELFLFKIRLLSQDKVIYWWGQSQLVKITVLLSNILNITTLLFWKLGPGSAFIVLLKAFSGCKMNVGERLMHSWKRFLMIVTFHF